MRQLCALPDPENARRLSDYLASQSIETRVEREADGWAVWVCDEDRVAAAREEFQRYRQEPTHPRYLAARPKPPEPEPHPSPRPVEPSSPLTFVLIFLSTATTGLYFSPEKPFVARDLFITATKIDDEKASWIPGLHEVRSGEVWRVVTPIFVHFTAVHLLFNMMWLWSLGRQIEERYGTGWFMILVLMTAALSNLSQYYLVELSFKDGGLVIEREGSPLFGGMSGVVFGLFGYVWMKSLYEPGCGLVMTRGAATMLMCWLFVCMTGVVGPIANVAHVAGLIVGLIAGYAGAMWNGFGTR